MHQSRICVDANMRLHAKVLRVARFGLAHVEGALASLVLSRTGRCNDGGMNHAALLELRP
jgi:hypothetical protein